MDGIGPQLLSELSHVAENLGWRDLRSWSEFFGSAKAPQWSRKHVEQRVVTNFLHYRTNYLVACLIILLVKILFAPVVLLSLVAISILFISLLFIIKGDIIVGETTIDLKGKQIICGVGTVIIISISGTLEHILLSLVYGIVFCLLHMIFRPRNIASKSYAMAEEMKFSFFSGSSSNGDSSSNPYSDRPDPENPPFGDDGTRKRNGSTGSVSGVSSNTNSIVSSSSGSSNTSSSGLGGALNNSHSIYGTGSSPGASPRQPLAKTVSANYGNMVISNNIIGAAVKAD